MKLGFGSCKSVGPRRINSLSSPLPCPGRRGRGRERKSKKGSGIVTKVGGIKWAGRLFIIIF